MTDNLDSTAIVVALIVSLCSLLGVLFTATVSALVLFKTRQTHELVNSRMSEFITSLRDKADAQIGEARATGVAAGEQAQRDRTSEPP
jgi:hypothetical protein